MRTPTLFLLTSLIAGCGLPGAPTSLKSADESSTSPRHTSELVQDEGSDASDGSVDANDAGSSDGSDATDGSEGSGDDEAAPGPGEARIAVRLTDAPGDYEAVPVTIARIEAHLLAPTADDPPEGDEDADDTGAPPPSAGPPEDAGPPDDGDDDADEDETEEEDGEEEDEEEVGDEGSWLTLVSEPQTFDLLTLQDGVSAALGSAIVEPGAYDQVRLIVSEAAVVVDGETHDLFIPSGEQTGFKLSYDYQVEAAGTYELMLDFDARESVRQTGSGQYKLQPVITVAYFGPPQDHPEDEPEAEGDTGSPSDTGAPTDTGM